MNKLLFALLLSLPLVGSAAPAASGAVTNDCDLCDSCFKKRHGSPVRREVNEATNEAVDTYADGTTRRAKIDPAPKGDTKPKKRRAEEDKPALPTEGVPPDLARARRKYNKIRNGVNVHIKVPKPLLKEEK